MIDEIYKCYVKFRQMCLEEYRPFGYLKAVVRISPKSFFELREELAKKGEYCQIDEGIYYIGLGGEKTPVIIDDEMPKEVEFQILSRTDYEREEQEKLFKKMAKIFDD